MNFRDVPNLLKFEQHARLNSEDEIVMDCYRRIRELIAPVPRPSAVLDALVRTEVRARYRPPVDV